MRQRILVKAGRLFCQQNAIVSETDKRIMFEVNAEDCYRSAQTWTQAKVIVGVLFALTLAGLLVGNESDYAAYIMTVLLVICFAVAVVGFRRIHIKNKIVFQMAEKWAPERRKLLRLIKIGKSWDSVTFQPTNDEEGVREEFRTLFKNIALCTAMKIVKIESLTCSSTHKKEDTHKGDLGTLANSLGLMAVSWDSVFETAIKMHGKRVRLD